MESITQNMEDEIKNFCKAWLVVLASLFYSYFLASKIPKGILRFISLLPIFSLFTLLPLSLSRPIPTIIIGSSITWLANFKLLLYSFNHGPLSTNNPQKSLLKFIFLAIFPIKLKEKTQVKPSNNGQKMIFPLNFWSKISLWVIMHAIYHYKMEMVVLGLIVYLSMDIIFGACGLFLWLTLGLELEPPSNEPYLSSSLRDFWSRRWNRVMSDALSHTIYKPVVSMALNFVGKKWAPIPGVLATFVVSGLIHELVFYYVTRVSPTWEVTWFFVLHGLCLIVETGLKRVLGPKWRLNWFVSILLTGGFIIATSFWLFFPPLMRNHVYDRISFDTLDFGLYVKEMVMGN